MRIRRCIKKSIHRKAAVLVVVALCCTGVAIAAVPEKERQALIDLYASTNGPSWKVSTNWNGPPGTECTWFGVHCDSRQTTVGFIELRDNRLSGTLPESLTDLTNLATLFLAKNQFTVSFPTVLTEMVSLQVLNLSHNYFSGPIPSELGNLTNMTYLDLSENWFSGSIPPALANLANLEYLFLFTNKLTGPIPAELGGLAKLRYLYLHENQLSGPIPSELAALTSLMRLSLSSNQFTGTIPTAFGNLTGLFGLFLSSNQLEGTIPTELCGLTRLDSIALSSNRLTGEIPPCITRWAQLRPGWSDFRWNGLYSSDPVVVAFVDEKQMGGDWQSSQTVPVSGIGAAVVSRSSIALTWTPIPYSGDTGGYRVFHSTRSGGPWTLSGMTADKLAPGWLATGLQSGTTYYFVVRSVTNPHSSNTNTVESDPTEEVQRSTARAETLTVTKSGLGSGNVTSDPPGINCGTACSAAFDHGAEVTLTHHASEGSIFTGWHGACAGMGPCTVTLDAARTVEATFARLIPNAERAALIDLFNSTNGSGWTVRTNWRNAENTDFGPPGSECEWYGVTCWEPAAVQIINLPSNNLAGTLPPTLAAMTNMAGLHLESNQLTGPIPSELGSLPLLETINLGGNRLTGPIPATFGHSGFGFRTNLSRFDLSSNQITGEVPNSITNLTSLTPGMSDFRWNGLHSSNPAVVTFLNRMQTGGDWQSTQTVPVTNLAAGSPTPTSIILTWTPILYTENGGGYEVSYSTSSAGPWVLFETTEDKLTPRSMVTALNPDSPYFFTVRSVTSPHAENEGTVRSDLSEQVFCATAAASQVLVVARSGSGAGVVLSDPAGIDCGTSCSASYPYGTVVRLTPIAADGSTFGGWSGACTGGGVCDVTMDAAQSLVASFAAANSVLLVVEIVGTGRGSVTSTPGGIDCGETCVASFERGALVTLTQAAAPGSRFAGWSGACSGMASCTFHMTTDMTVAAGFRASGVRRRLQRVDPR